MDKSTGTMIMSTGQGISGAFEEQNISSNHIMVYMGSYIINQSKEDNDFITYERDPNTSYKSYMDLETTECFMVDKDKCLEFEIKYLVLYLHILEYSVVEYYKKYCELQKWYKEQLMHRSQPEVIKEMQETYERKYKALYPSFYKIDSIANLPIENYVKTHPADGFIENFCLSPEEYMRVKLYRKQRIEKSCE